MTSPLPRKPARHGSLPPGLLKSGVYLQCGFMTFPPFIRHLRSIKSFAPRKKLWNIRGFDEPALRNAYQWLRMAFSFRTVLFVVASIGAPPVRQEKND